MNEVLLYDRDVVLWSEQQAALLRAAASARRNEPIDWENVAQEIESVGRAHRTEVRSRLFRIVEHLLRLQFSPAREPRRLWAETIGQQRADLELLLEDAPSLQPQLAALLDGTRAVAVRRAAGSLAAYGEAAAAERVREHAGSFTLEQVLGDWFPSGAQEDR